MKKDHITVRFIEADEMEAFLPILKYTDLTRSKKKLLFMLKDMSAMGYRCAIVFDDHKAVGMIGVWIVSRLYVGKIIEYDNLFLLPKYRNKGIGRKMIRFVNRYAHENECVAAELSCAIEEKKSQKFWEKLGFEIVGLRYRKPLDKADM
jgi:ribosomal protein S18 acetylase RimI-like enzyme